MRIWPRTSSVKKTRPSGATSSANGALVFSSSATFSKFELIVPPQSPGSTPAAHLTPPTMCASSAGSVKCAPKWPMPVTQARPPS